MTGMRPRLTFVICVGSLLLMAALAHADGEELMPGGAQAIGRGGASAARPTDGMAMLLNPAGLIDLQEHQVFAGLDTAFDSICVQPYGYYGWGVYVPEQRPGAATNLDATFSEFGDSASAAYGQRRLDSVCNSAPAFPVPQLTAVFRPLKRLRIGIGFVAPAFVTGAQWGGSDGTIEAGGGARPTPTRYQLVQQNVKFALNPTLSAAFEALPWLAFGATFQVAMASVESVVVTALRAGTDPANDMLGKVAVSDYFMPNLAFSVYVKPSARWSLAGTFAWSNGIDAAGELTYTTNVFHQGATGSEAAPFQNDPVQLKRVRVGLPWSATLAARYAQPRAGARGEAEDRQRDPFTRELWDVELDASLIGNRSVGPNRIEIAEEFALEFRRADKVPQMPLTIHQSDLSELSVDRHGLNVVVLRLGGSFVALPGRLQLSLGGFFQSRGVAASYASVDSYGFARVGVGLGATVRLGAIDLMASYAHIFQEDLVVVPPKHAPRTEGTSDPRTGFDQRIYEDGQLSERPRTDARAPAASQADAVAGLQQTAALEASNLHSRVVNSGRYTAGFDVLSIAAAYRF